MKRTWKFHFFISALNSTTKLWTPQPLTYLDCCFGGHWSPLLQEPYKEGEGTDEKPGNHPDFRKMLSDWKEHSRSSGYFSEQLSELKKTFSEWEIRFSEWRLKIWAMRKTIGGQKKGTTKKLCDKDFCRTFGWTFWCDLPQNPCFIGNGPVNPLELFWKFFGAVRALFWLCESFLAPETTILGATPGAFFLAVFHGFGGLGYGLEFLRSFCRKNLHVHKIPLVFGGGGVFGFGGGSVFFLFLWARGFFWTESNCVCENTNRDENIT